MYDPLYGRIPAFERATGLTVEIVDRLPHPELNARVKRDFEAGDPDLDLISTHTKYAPSQAAWLSSLDDLPIAAERDDFLPRPFELARIDGTLLQVPRNLDVRLLYYRRDLLDGNGGGPRPEVPRTWDALVETAAGLTRPDFYGFLFPGRDSGLFGTFYELLVSAGGQLFDDDLRPAFDRGPGVWAADTIAELHARRRVTPRELPEWHYDEISQAFRQGHSAMVCDWPGSHHLYIEASEVADRTGVALLPTGPAGRRAAYAGCHSFAIPKTAKNREGAARLLDDLTSTAAQLDEARCGAIPVRASALAQIQAEAAADAAEAHRWHLLTRTQEAMIMPPRFAAYAECEDELWHAVQRAMRGLVAPTEALAEGARRIAALLDRTRPTPQPDVV